MFETEALVIKNLVHPMLIGLNSITECKRVVHFNTRVVKVGTDRLPLYVSDIASAIHVVASTVSSRHKYNHRFSSRIRLNCMPGSARSVNVNTKACRCLPYKLERLSLPLDDNYRSIRATIPKALISILNRRSQLLLTNLTDKPM